MVQPDDEVFAITSAGGVIRTSAAEIKQSGRQTMGVRLVNLTVGTSLVAIARNAESLVNGEDLDADETDISSEESVTPDGSPGASPGSTDAITDSVSPDGEMADDDDESAGQGGLPADDTDDQ
jgi:hypothetical protein